MALLRCSSFIAAATFFYSNSYRSYTEHDSSQFPPNRFATRSVYPAVVNKTPKKKPSICTADELHYVPVSGSNWLLALWRYTPSPEAPRRNHPLLLLSGVGTNAIGFDLSPESSFARYMSKQGYDTWILEVRGAGLSARGVDHGVLEQTGNESEVSPSKGNRTDMISKADRSQSLPKLIGGGFQNAGSLDERENSSIASQEGQISFNLLLNLQEKFSTTIEYFREQLDLIVKYDWDFDHYLEEDLPAAVEYVRTQCKPKNGKLLAIGHSMGGILLYAMLSRCCYEGRDSGLVSIVTLGSSLDFTSSKSSLKMLLPLADPARLLNVSAIPLGALLTAAHPLASRPPYTLFWLNSQISARGMMHPELFKKLVLNNFGTISTKLLLQLSTVFQEGGLCNRNGTFCYKDYTGKINIPVLALAGDQDLICPPEAVYETVKVIPESLVTYKVFGEPSGPHYGHYDLVGSRVAADEVYSCIVEFLNHHDKV